MRLPSRLFLVGLVLGVAGATAAACADSESETASEDGASSLPTVDGAGDGDVTDASCEAGDACAPPAVDCTRADFCVVNAPVPSHVSLNAIWGSSANDVWAVGTRGTILHGDGTSFSSVPSGITVPLFSVWGTAPDDVWVVASRAPLHATALADGGTRWVSMEGETWNPDLENEGRTWAIWGSSRSDVRMAGLPSGRFGGFGSFWSKGTSPDGGLAWNAVDTLQLGAPNAEIRALWGAGPNDVWGVGALGQAFQYEPPGDASAAHWTERNSQTLQTLEGLWGTSASDVWAVGQEGIIRHLATSASKSFDVVASPTTRALHGVWGSGPTDVWAVGDGATLLHYDGKTWTLANAGLPDGVTPDLFGVWGSGTDDVWIVGEELILHRTKTNRRHL